MGYRKGKVEYLSLIHISYREESIRESREYLSAEIGGECRFEKVQSVISQLEKMRFSFQDIEKLNLLAQSLLEEEGKNIWKYKALLETKDVYKRQAENAGKGGKAENGCRRERGLSRRRLFCVRLCRGVTAVF